MIFGRKKFVDSYLEKFVKTCRELDQWSDPCKEQWRKVQVQQVLLTWLGQVGKWLLFHILGPYWCKSIGKMGTSVQWELPAMEQSYSICCQFKWRKPETHIPSKLWQKIGYGKTSLHISHHNLFYNYCCPLISL